MSGVQDNRPPAAVLRWVDPILRALIPSPAGRLVPRSVGVLRFTGRRSGRTLRLVVGVHQAGGAAVVITSRPWRLNFRGGRPVEVARSGRWASGTGHLVENPEEVAAALREIIAGGTSPRVLGLRIARGADVDAQDVRATGRTLVRLDVVP